jgi:DNA transposition AAA+ family ATPase
VITGGAGVSKTSAFEHYKATRPNVWILTAEPSTASPYAMLEYLREVLGIPETKPHLTSRAITTKLMNSQGLIIIDEAQHLAIKCIEQLRSIYDRANIGIVFAGNLDVWSRIDGGGRKAEFAQLFSRVGMRVTVNKPSNKDIEVMLDALNIIADEQRKMLTFIAKEPGALRVMMKTLRVARMLAIGADEELAKEHISSAWKRLSGREVGAA